VGLLYDEAALDAAWDLVKDWTEEERQQLRRDVPKMGLQTPFRNKTLREIALAVLAISAKMKACSCKNSTGLRARAALMPINSSLILRANGMATSFKPIMIAAIN